MELLQVQGEVTKVHTMSNRSLRLQFDTQENLTDEQVGKITSYFEKVGHLTFSPERQIVPEDLLALPEITIEKGEKSPSKRLYDRMLAYYKTKHANFEGFEEWYRKSLDKIGQGFLDKIV